jgi:hypothetical protein
MMNVINGGASLGDGFGSENETARAVERCAQGSAWG